MTTKALPFLLLLFCCSCSHNGGAVKEEDKTLQQLSRADAQTRLEETKKDLAAVDEQIRSAQTRRDTYDMQAQADVNKQNKVEGTEAELANLETKRGALLHRQHVIEGRLRELGAGEESSDVPEEKAVQPY